VLRIWAARGEEASGDATLAAAGVAGAERGKETFAGEWVDGSEIPTPAGVVVVGSGEGRRLADVAGVTGE
jgi:hypothetical protein